MSKPAEDRALANIGQARRLLAEAGTLEDVKKIIDVAAAADLYYRRARESHGAHFEALRVKAAAEMKAGDMVNEIPREQGKRTDTSRHRGVKLVADVNKEYGEGTQFDAGSTWPPSPRKSARPSCGPSPTLRRRLS